MNKYITIIVSDNRIDSIREIVNGEIENGNMFFTTVECINNDKDVIQEKLLIAGSSLRDLLSK